jgi:hypothetical protein
MLHGVAYLRILAASIRHSLIPTLGGSMQMLSLGFRSGNSIAVSREVAVPRRELSGDFLAGGAFQKFVDQSLIGL